MLIKEIGDKSDWNVFFEQNGSLSFLESWEWANVQKELNYQIKRIGIYDKNNLQAIALVVEIRSRRGDFLFIPHGPIFKLNEKNLKIKTILTYLTKFLITKAKNERFSFLRIAPVLEHDTTYQNIFKKCGFNKAPIYMHAERVWVLELDKKEDEILLGMRKTTRYLIRKAVRDEVIIEKRTDTKAVDDFYKLYLETVRREKFTPFSKKYVKLEFENFLREGNAMFFFGKTHPSNYLASALILFTKSTAFYHQGASIHTKIPVTYLLQWEAIKEAKKRGCRFYNFWGILQKGRSPKNWTGLTLFKQGFGGHMIDYLPTQDLIVSPKYYLTYLYEKYLMFKRGV